VPTAQPPAVVAGTRLIPIQHTPHSQHATSGCRLPSCPAHATGGCRLPSCPAPASSLPPCGRHLSAKGCLPGQAAAQCQVFHHRHQRLPGGRQQAPVQRPAAVPAPQGGSDEGAW
jgi:hypothetical protein